MYGLEDKLVSFEMLKYFFDSIKYNDKKLVIIEGGYYNLNYDIVIEKIVEEIVFWFNY